MSIVESNRRSYTPVQQALFEGKFFNEIALNNIILSYLFPLYPLFRCLGRVCIGGEIQCYARGQPQIVNDEGFCLNHDKGMYSFLHFCSPLF
jgi:hypothetical protein